MSATTGRAIATTLIFFAAPVFAASTGPSGGGPPMSTPGVTEQSPQENARSTYNSAARDLKRADKQAAAAADARDERRKAKAEKKAHDLYARARAKLVDVVKALPDMPEAWNLLGYAERNLGDYQSALAAYDRALALSPSFPEAIEYRAEAHLALNRIEDAKQAYLDLFAGNRKLAGQLLEAMRRWVEAQRISPSEVDEGTVSALAAWIDERATIAQQTSALTREGADSSWR